MNMDIIFLEEIPDFPNYYAANNGVIMDKNDKVVEGVRGEDGYYRVNLINYEGLEKSVLVHELIAKAFGVEGEGNIIFHKNWDRSDNQPDNLIRMKKEDVKINGGEKCNSKNLCGDIKCVECYNKSFASSSKVKWWNSENKLTPREVFKSSSNKFILNCECNHKFTSALDCIGKGTWCPYCAHIKLCNNLKCQDCFQKSFASSDKAIFWSKENKLTPREVFKSSNNKYKFDCGCGHTFENSLSAIKSGKWCIYCSNPPQKLCKDINCDNCFRRSFASSVKAPFWSKENIDIPRNVFSSSGKKYKFDCNCGHSFISSLNNIKKGQWCPYCIRGGKLCDSVNCNTCFKKSFASSERVNWWSKENKLTPREVFKSSHEKYKFDCDCDHTFEASLGNITTGYWCSYCSNKQLCNTHNCDTCFQKSFASSEKAKWWSKENELTPREVFKSSHEKYKFDCDCGHTFKKALHAISKGSWCPYCCTPQQKLCNDINCRGCLGKSFEVSDKVKFWSQENQITPRYAFKNAHIKYKFVWNCGHQTQEAPHNLRKSNNCTKCDSCPSCQLWLTQGKLCNWCKPKSDNKLYQKTKEMDVVRFLRDKLPDREFIHNKSVSSDCTGTHLFPDVLFDCNFYYLIVEIDEHKHRGADYKCDEQRMYDIIAKLGLPCIFIRYNPDGSSKNPSDKNVLFERVNYYLDLNENIEVKVWDDFGFKVEYLYY